MLIDFKKKVQFQKKFKEEGRSQEFNNRKSNRQR